MFMTLHKEPPLTLKDDYPVFNRLAIETHSKCNRACSFCPVSTGRRDFTGQSMDPELFESICVQLEELQWNGFIEFFVLNEPLIDPEYHKKAERLRRASPRSTIYCSTNGDKIAGANNGLDAMKKLYDSGVNSVNLNIYDEGDKGQRRADFYLQLIDDLEDAGIASFSKNKYAKKPFTKNFVHLTDMRLDRIRDGALDIFFNKTAEDRPETVKNIHCARPHRHLLILWNGVVPLCCAMDPTDPEGVYVGNANTQSLLEVWNSEAMQKHRFFLQTKERSALKACQTCEHRMAYPHAVRHIEVSSAIEEKWRREEVQAVAKIVPGKTKIPSGG